MKRIPLADADLNRAAHIRSDRAALESLWCAPNSLCAFLSEGDPVIHAHDGQLVWISGAELPLQALDHAVFLGLDKSGAGIFVVPRAHVGAPVGDIDSATTTPFRAALGTLSPATASLMSTARALIYWHDTVGFCGKCGAVTRAVEGGWKRLCPSCVHEVFPRTDPVAIMLATHDDRCLLGRGPNWPAGFMSCLAGFVEPGESVEQAACRELYEEAGILARPQNAQYLFSQPWPFPASLMMGLIIEADTTEITLHDKELEVAQWVSRKDVRDILAGTHAELYAPPPQAIAFHIMHEWAMRD